MACAGGSCDQYSPMMRLGVCVPGAGGRGHEIGLVFAYVLILLAPPADAQTFVKKCNGVEVHSMAVSYKVVPNISLDAKQETIEIGPSATDTQHIAIVALGPVLGSMDSRKVSTDLACTIDGLVLTAAITRSAAYKGTTAKNILWRPEITIVIVPRQLEISFQASWRMRLTNGQNVGRFRTPPFPEQQYPITVRKTLRAAN